MDKIATENLFLLEFLVDDVNIDPKCDCDSPPGELCVSFQFLDNAALDICEADFCPARDYGKDAGAVKSGKSCLFSMTPAQADNALQNFDICVNIFKKMQPGWLPEKIQSGSALISVANLFGELIEAVSVTEGNTPTAKTLKDIFDVANTTNQVIGKINIYIRMSCFGKLIVTQFQMNLEDKSVLFKDKEGKSLYRYKKSGKSIKDVKNPRMDIECPVAMNPANNLNCPFSPCVMDQAQMQAPPPNQPNMPNYCPPPNQPNNYCPPPEMPMVTNFPMAVQQPQGPQIPCNECGAMVNPACLAAPGPNNQLINPWPLPPAPPGPPCVPPPPCVPDGNYQEIGASMGNNSLTIRVHKDKGTIEPVSGCPPPTTSQSYEMRPGVQQGNQHHPFAFKMGGKNAEGNNNVSVTPPCATAPDGTQFTEFSDPNKEMFILRIGKKSEGVDKKANLELELCTPKGPELKPIPKKETRDTQYDEKDAGAEAKKKGKPAGKGGKGGKKKGKGGAKGKKGKK